MQDHQNTAAADNATQNTTSIGTLKTVEGLVTVRRAGQEVPVQAGQTLHSGDVIHAAAGGQALIDFAPKGDGQTLTHATVVQGAQVLLQGNDNGPALLTHLNDEGEVLIENAPDAEAAAVLASAGATGLSGLLGSEAALGGFGPAAGVVGAVGLAGVSGEDSGVTDDGMLSSTDMGEPTHTGDMSGLLGGGLAAGLGSGFGGVVLGGGALLGAGALIGGEGTTASGSTTSGAVPAPIPSPPATLVADAGTLSLGQIGSTSGNGGLAALDTLGVKLAGDSKPALAVSHLSLLDPSKPLPFTDGQLPIAVETVDGTPTLKINLGPLLTTDASLDVPRLVGDVTRLVENVLQDPLSVTHLASTDLKLNTPIEAFNQPANGLIGVVSDIAGLNFDAALLHGLMAGQATPGLGGLLSGTPGGPLDTLGNVPVVGDAVGTVLTGMLQGSVALTDVLHGDVAGAQQALSAAHIPLISDLVSGLPSTNGSLPGFGDALNGVTHAVSGIPVLGNGFSALTTATADLPILGQLLGGAHSAAGLAGTGPSVGLENGLQSIPVLGTLAGGLSGAAPAGLESVPLLGPVLGGIAHAASGAGGGSTGSGLPDLPLLSDLTHGISSAAQSGGSGALLDPTRLLGGLHA